METLMPGRMPRAGLLLLPLLLCFGQVTTRRINPAALIRIINHVTKHGVNDEYAFAVSLDRTHCENPYRLTVELPVNKLQEMQEAISQTDGLYESVNVSIVAARMKRLDNVTGEHAEWRLLKGGQNSIVQKLLARTYKTSGCLIFFTLNSPCVEPCLQENEPYSILKMVRDTFHPINDNYKAFVFRQIYQEQNMTCHKRLQAWLRLQHMSVPLLHCDNNYCRYCFNEDDSINIKSLYGM